MVAETAQVALSHQIKARCSREDKQAFAAYCRSVGKTESQVVLERIAECIRRGRELLIEA